MPFHSESVIEDLTKRAQELRIQVLKMVYRAQSGHLGGSLSAAEIVSVLYFHHLRVDPHRPDWPKRDRFILSKGHAAPVVYAALAGRGFFPKEELLTLRQMDSILQGHPDRLKTPGIEMTTGVLGHGLGVGVGLALAAKLNGARHRTFVLLGDGEIDAGIVWEAAMTANKYQLDNLTAILDFNGVQLDGPVSQIMPLEPMKDKWEAFGWQALEIDGHNVRQILEGLHLAESIHDRPTIVIAHTTKGKEVSFMEGKSYWHGRPPNREQYEAALAELEGRGGD